MIFRTLFLLVLGLALAGCPDAPTYGGCGVDTDCALGQTCLDKTCIVSNPCDNVTCSNHGQCVVNANVATCACDEGFRPEGLSCLPLHGIGGNGGESGAGGQAGTGGTALLDAALMVDAETPARDMAMAAADGGPPRPVAPCGNNCPGLDFVAITGGPFQMGSNEGDEHERPIHAVNIANFELLRNEVTVAQYRACVVVGACDEPETGGDYNWSANTAGLENHPINGVSWDNAVQFCQWVGARLPSEAEWAYAARSQGQNITYPWGDEPPACDRLNFSGCDGDDGADTSRVCAHQTGHSAQGLCDLAGNVFEWVEDDWHASYAGAPNDDSPWVDNPRGSARVSRGGSWYGGAGVVRAAHRYRDTTGFRGSYLGFRPARSVPAP